MECLKLTVIQKWSGRGFLFLFLAISVSQICSIGYGSFHDLGKMPSNRNKDRQTFFVFFSHQLIKSKFFLLTDLYGIAKIGILYSLQERLEN